MKFNSEIGVLFDMDGVIVDTNPYHKKAFDIFLEKYQLQLTDEELTEHVYGRTNKEIMQYLIKDNYTEEKANAWADEKEALYRSLYRENMEPVAGVIDFLNQLKVNNIKAAVGTSAPIENLQMVVDGLDLDPYFSAYLKADDVINGKPDPEVYLKAAERINIAPDQCVVFEDSIAGVKAGKRGGMKVVGLSTTHSAEELNESDMVISDFSDMTIDKLRTLFA